MSIEIVKRLSKILNSWTRPIARTRRRIPELEQLEQRVLLTAISSGQTISSSIGSLGDVDTYEIQASAGDDLLLTAIDDFEGSEFRLKVSLFAPNGDLVAENSAQDGLVLNVSDVTQTGTYQYVVSEEQGDEVANYTLTAVVPDEQVDANNVALTSGQTVTGTLGAGDIDTFTISADTGDDIYISAIDDIVGSEFRLSVALYAPDGTWVAGSDAQSGLSFIRYDVPQTGVYTIVVREEQGDALGNYTLTALVPDDVVDNDNVAATSGQTYSGTLGAGDIDTYTISADAGEDIYISAIDDIAGSEFRLAVALHAPDGTWVAGTEAQSGLSYIRYDVPQTGVYTIVVREEQGDATGNYTLTAVVPDDEIDNDNVAATSGQTYTGTLDAGDIDTFTISADAGDDIVLSAIDDVVDPSFRLAIAVHAPDGTWIAGTDAQSGLSLIHYDLPQTGTYTIVVREEQGDASGNYTLTAVVPDNEVDADNVALNSGQTVTGTISDGDIDTFTISADAGDDILLSAIDDVTGSLFRLSVALYAPDGTQINATDAQSGLRLDNYDVPQTGTYTFVVWESQGNATANYTLTAVVADDQVDADNVELLSGQNQTATITEGDIDTYTIFAREGDALQLTANDDADGSLFNLLVSLHAPDGTWLAETSSQSGLTLNVSALPATGLYTYIVREAQGNATAGYNLTATRIPAVQYGASLVGRLGGNWWVAQSNGSNLSTQYWGSWDQNAGWTDVQVADVDGDNDDDIVGRNSAGQWWVARNTGNSFTTEYWGYWGDLGWQDVQVADVDNDGDADIVGRSSTGQWWVARSNGTDSFTNELWGGWVENAGWNNVMVADLDRDGNMDIVGQSNNGQWWAARSNGSSFTTEYWGYWVDLGWQDVQVADVDNDGDSDIVGRSSAGQWWVARSNGSNGFTNELWGGWVESAGWNNVLVTDLDGDGNQDIIGQSNNGQWWAARSDGSSFATEYWGYWVDLGWQDVLIIDVDQDGDADVAGRTSSGEIWIAHSDGVDGFDNELWGAWSAGNWVNVSAFNSGVAAIPPEINYVPKFDDEEEMSLFL